MDTAGGQVALAELDHTAALGGIHDRFSVWQPEAVILIGRVGRDSSLELTLQVQDPEVVGCGLRLLLGEENSSTIRIEADPRDASGFSQNLGLAGPVEPGHALPGGRSGSRTRRLRPERSRSSPTPALRR